MRVARRSPEDYQPGRPFLDHYLPSLLTPTLYHVDGQQQDEVFIWGSWLQSRMHAAGVTCSDCHDPHTQKLRAPGNAVCAQCHEPSKYDVVAHHRHEPGTAGAQCANCHMPQNTYMVVDPRRDHSLRVPRPDESVTFGVPNACNSCHTDRDAKWAAKAVHDWLGRDAAGYQTFASVFYSAEGGEPSALDKLAAVAADTAQPAIVRASALARLAGSGQFTRDFAQTMSRDASPLVRLATVQLADVMPPRPVRTSSVRCSVMRRVPCASRRRVRSRVAMTSCRRNCCRAGKRRRRSTLPRCGTMRIGPSPASRSVASGRRWGRLTQLRTEFAAAIQLDPEFVPAYVNAADVLVRLATVELADVMPAETRAVVLGPLLGDATRAVRIEAARSLAGGQDRLPQELLPRWEAASQEYVATLGYNADRPESRVALGGFDAALGQADAAQAQFAAAIRLDPEFVPAYVNAADVLRAQGRDRESADMLQQGLLRAPLSATLHHALGLAQIRLQQPELAMASLRRAVELDPATARYAYVYSVALHSTGQVDESIRRLQEAVRRWPYDREMLMALTSFQLESGRRQDAQATARKLVAAYPQIRRCAYWSAQALGEQSP